LNRDWRGTPHIGRTTNGAASKKPAPVILHAGAEPAPGRNSAWVDSTLKHKLARMGFLVKGEVAVESGIC